MTKDKTKVTQLVRNLLARAESTNSESEARLCRQRADKLIFDHSLRLSELTKASRVPVSMAQRTFVCRGRYKVQLRNGLARVLSAYGTVYVACKMGKKDHVLFWFGEDVDVALLDLVVPSLEKQALRAMQAQCRSVGYVDDRFRRSAIVSFFRGVCSQIRQAKKEALDTDNAQSLVVLKQEKGRQFAADNHVLRQARTPQDSTYLVPGAYQAGLKATLTSGVLPTPAKTISAHPYREAS